MASITITQTRTATSTDYTVTTTVTAALGIPPEVFVYTAGGAYTNVAVLEDLAYPTTPASDQAFYRQTYVTQTFNSVNDALSAAAVHKRRVQQLVDEYTAAVEGFAGTETVTYVGA